MMKRYIAVLVCAVMIITSIPLTLIAATTRSISFYVAANTTAGLSERLDVLSIDSLTANQTYSGDVNLPAGVTVSSLKLSWSSSNISSVKNTSGTTQRSGNVSIVASGNTLTLRVYLTSSTYATVKLTTKQSQITIPELKFFVPADERSNIYNDFYATETKVNTTSFKEEFKYMPGGSADYSSAKLSWSDDSLILKDKNGNDCVSGEVLLDTSSAGAEYTATYYNDDKTESLTVTYTVKMVMHGAWGVEPMVFNFDESKGTIANMNKDKANSCYGTITFLGKTYYVSMKGRGNHTWTDCTKKPYNFTLMKDDKFDDKIDKKQEFIPDCKSKKWSLLANAADCSLVRNKIGYDLAEKMGIGLKSRFVDVWVNGDFWGNYLLTPKNDYATEDDGYLIELDNKNETEDPQFALNGITGTTDSVNKFTVKDFGDDAVAVAIEAGYTYIVDESGKVIKDETYKFIQDWMQQMLNAVLDTTSDDYLNYIDIDSWAKMYLMHELEKNYDVISGSIFMHRDGLTADDKLIAGPVWDVDNAFGRSQQSIYSRNCSYSGIDNTTQHSGGGWYIDSINGKTSLFQFLGKHKSFMERVYSIYNEYKTEINELPIRVDEQVAVLGSSIDMNFDRWGYPSINTYNTTVYTSNTTIGTGTYALSQIKTTTYADYITNLKTYLTVRAKFFSDNLSVTNPDVTASGNTELFAGETLSFSVPSGYDGYQWQISKKGKTWDNIENATSNVYTKTAEDSDNGKYYRCAVLKKGSLVDTTRVADSNTSTFTYATLSPVKIIEVEVERIDITSPEKLNYFVGDTELSTLGMSVTAYYNNGTSAVVTADCVISGFDTSVAGTNKITVTYSEKTDTFDINVVAVTVERIEVTAPTKTDYFVGDFELSTLGMSVTAYYNNGTSAVVTADCTVSGFDTSVAGTNKITVTYSEKTDTFDIEVTEHEHVSYSIYSTVLPTSANSGSVVFKCDGCNHTITEKVEFTELGDVNGDGVLNVSDCVLILLYVNNGNELSLHQIAVADLNGDTVIDINDAKLLSEYISKSKIMA